MRTIREWTRLRRIPHNRVGHFVYYDLAEMAQHIRRTKLKMSARGRSCQLRDLIAHLAANGLVVSAKEIRRFFARGTASLATCVPADREAPPAGTELRRENHQLANRQWLPLNPRLHLHRPRNSRAPIATVKLESASGA